ncbi:unnamed protein product [Owenia fusiformis]|uniref:Trafficking protein particle complex subunit 11 n=1 Tax=Owenia fusiformis TaxID=6347 RepID=A0A8S4N5F4_OWEFU|nr:unnamed protein product [Owenia fusiformis]
MSWASDLPEELLCRPMGLVVLTGLDVTYNAIHKTIWDSFCNNRRPDRVPLNFKVLAADHEYPKCRSKRTSYEWYIPKGIVKSNWLKKHLSLVPAVVVIFFDLDWDEQMWKEKQVECACKVKIVRDSLSGRSTKVAVVLIQRNAPLPPGEDMVAAERAASLCNACELSAKSLFVLPHTDHLLGYTIRLENAFYELSQSYYHGEARKIKTHKEFLNKTTHQLLFVRHQFKIAFYNEMKQDSHTALKHYKLSYGHILELRMHDTNLLEIKIIAGYINYKVCRLSFQHNAPLDAIAQFRKHIDFFKSRDGQPELAFEHSAWMSKQFQMFADLFDEAIKMGLTAIQTQHPGIYYQQAANHAVARKQLCQGLCHSSNQVISPDPLELLDKLDYYGQRPWRQGHHLSVEPPDILRERDGIQALQQVELKVDHSWLIIPLLSSAVAQFKKYKSPRMKRYLMVQMGEEYYHAKDYNKALTLLSRVTWDYRAERWWSLLTSILSTLLRCAYLVGNIQEYVTVCLELTTKYIQCSPEEKTRIQMNLVRVMACDPPEAEPGCNMECVETAKPLWKVNHSPDEPCVFTIEMQNIVPFVECKAMFTETSFTADCPIVIKVYLRTSCPFPIRFSSLAVLLNEQDYNVHCKVTDGQPINSGDEIEADAGDLYLVPNQIRCYTFSFLVQKEDVGKSIEMNGVALSLGSQTTRCAVLHWVGGGGDAVSSTPGQLHHHPGVIRGHIESNPEWDNLTILSSTKIETRPARVNIEVLHEAPVLVNEFYYMKINISNNEEKPINQISVSVGLQEGEDSAAEQSTHVNDGSAEFDGQVVNCRTDVTLPPLKPGDKHCKDVYIKCLQAGNRKIDVKVSYCVDVSTEGASLSCSCCKDVTLDLNVVEPFNIAVNLASMKFDKITSVHADAPFLLIPTLTSSSPWPITIEGSTLQLSPFLSFEGDQPDTQLKGVSLKKDEQASECCCLVAPPSMQPTVAMGTYTVNWKRKSTSDTIPYVETSIELGNVAVEHIPILIKADIEAYGTVRTCLPVTYTLYNKTAYAQELHLTMDTSEAFMFSGHKQMHLRILPSSSYKLEYNMYPLVAGYVTLPKLQLNMLRYPGTMKDIIQSMLPSHIFIKPIGKAATAS